MAQGFSAAAMGRRIGGARKQSERWSMAAFSRALSVRLRERDPEFREASDKASARNRRVAA